MPRRRFPAGSCYQGDTGHKSWSLKQIQRHWDHPLADLVPHVIILDEGKAITFSFYLHWIIHSGGDENVNVSSKYTCGMIWHDKLQNDVF